MSHRTFTTAAVAAPLPAGCVYGQYFYIEWDEEVLFRADIHHPVRRARARSKNLEGSTLLSQTKFNASHAQF
jgi:hypothetical protein